MGKEVLREKHAEMIKNAPQDWGEQSFEEFLTGANIWDILDYQEQQIKQLSNVVQDYLDRTECVCDQIIPSAESGTKETPDLNCEIKNRIMHNTHKVENLIEQISNNLDRLEM